MSVREIAVVQEQVAPPVVIDGPERLPALVIDFDALVLRADAWREELHDIIKRGVGGGWVAEVRVVGQYTLEQAGWIAELTHLTGRRLRLVGSPEARPQLLPGQSATIETVDGREEFVVGIARRGRLEQGLKRAIDLVVTLPLLMLAAPLMALVALAVRLTSAGPALYAWRVVGENGRPFTGYKFRTMHNHADQRKDELVDLNEMIGPVFKMRRDPRITPLGRWLRRYSVDELPQLWSVLRGDMTLVGPRPAFQGEYQRYELWQMRRLSTKPGITCIWQVQGRNQINDFEEWASLDLNYIDNWSIWLDLRVLARTITAVLRGTGH